jgi:hypothetical protein
VRGQNSAVNLKHILLKDEMLAPDVNDTGLQCAARRAIVEQTTNTAVDFEGGGVKHAASEDRFEDSLVEGLALKSRRGGSHLVLFALLRRLQLKSVEGS